MHHRIQLLLTLFLAPILVNGLANSSNSYLVVSFPLYVCAMRPTNSTLLGMISISLVAASFQLCAMSDTDPTLLGLVGTSLVPASFNFCALCGDTDSSLHGFVCTSFVAATLHLGAALSWRHA